jgi:hypothetical protein
MRRDGEQRGGREAKFNKEADNKGRDKGKRESTVTKLLWCSLVAQRQSDDDKDDVRRG